MKASQSDATGIITSGQVRAARGLLGWTMDRLIAASGVPKSTLVRFENAAVTPRAATIAAIRAALETAGVIFIDQDGEGRGVRLKRNAELLHAAGGTGMAERSGAA